MNASPHLVEEAFDVLEERHVAPAQQAAALGGELAGSDWSAAIICGGEQPADTCRARRRLLNLIRVAQVDDCADLCTVEQVRGVVLGGALERR